MYIKLGTQGENEQDQVHVFRGQGHDVRGQGQGQGLGLQGQGQGQGHDQLSSRRLEAKAMASRTPSLMCTTGLLRVLESP